MPAGIVAPTRPYCRSCGWDFINSPNRDLDSHCDSCGDDLVASVGASADAPTALSATGGSLDVDFTWTDNGAADTTDFRHQTDGGAFTVILGDSSPTTVVAAEAEVVSGQVRSVVDGITGPWSVADSDAALA